MKVLSVVGSEAGCELRVMPLGPSDSSPCRKQFSTSERCSPQPEHRSAVLAGPTIASPHPGVNSTLLAAHTESICHFQGFPSTDPTVQADLCFST